MCRVIRPVLVGAIKVGILATRQVVGAGRGARAWLKGLYCEAVNEIEQERAAAREGAASDAGIPAGAAIGQGG